MHYQKTAKMLVVTYINNQQ